MSSIDPDWDDYVRKQRAQQQAYEQHEALRKAGLLARYTGNAAALLAGGKIVKTLQQEMQDAQSKKLETDKPVEKQLSVDVTNNTPRFRYVFWKEIYVIQYLAKDGEWKKMSNVHVKDHLSSVGYALAKLENRAQFYAKDSIVYFIRRIHAMAFMGAAAAYYTYDIEDFSL